MTGDDKMDYSTLCSDCYNSLMAENEMLQKQINTLASVLLDEFGGPTRDESACEMAVRLLRENRLEQNALREVLDWAIEASLQLSKDINSGMVEQFSAELRRRVNAMSCNRRARVDDNGQAESIPYPQPPPPKAELAPLAAEALEVRKPHRPEDLIGVLQDRVHVEKGKLLSATPIHRKREEN